MLNIFMKNQKVMKAIKLILIVFGLASVLSLSAQTFAEQPTVHMQSTSSMVGSGSELPQAAMSGVYTTYDNQAISGPKRIGGGQGGSGDIENPDDVYGTPIGDTPWALMLLLAGGYAICAWRKNKSDSRLAPPEKK